jgi:hypothetical protein
MSFEQSFLKEIKARFLGYKKLAEDSLNQLKNDDFHFKPSSESNSIAIIIQHMVGNMKSRFTNFLTEDGEKIWRDRDTEFENKNWSKEDLIIYWNEGWDCLINAMFELNEKNIQQKVVIRSEPITVSDALLRQLSHYSYHIGQIITLSIIIKNKDWKSLSIPKGKSNEYNQQKMK